MATIPEQLSKKIGTVDIPERTTGNLREEPPVKDNDFLKMLEAALFIPVLSLVRAYLMQSNGNRKTAENCLADFRRKHPQAFKTIFACDFVFRLVYLTIVFIVAVRGLGIVRF